LVLFSGALAAIPQNSTADAATVNPATLRGLLSESVGERRASAELLVRSGDGRLIAPLVDTLFFTPKRNRGEILRLLRSLAGTEVGDNYYDWVVFIGAHQELGTPVWYADWKSELLGRIDRRYRDVLYPGAPYRARLEEVVFGGVALEGIPSLDQPRAVPASEAHWLRDRDLVFGVAVEGETRAYAQKVLSWHEVVNDRVGGRPITLSYCTLCGSAVLFDTRTAGAPHTFGTSGLLYRSNKLMVDRATLTLWHNLTGEPVIGRLARSPIRLPILPVSTTTWHEWRRRHPGTSAAVPDAALARRLGYVYRQGAAESARRGVEFPVWRKSRALDPREEIFALRLAEGLKAYAIDRVIAEGVVNDVVGGRNVVVLADRDTGDVRAYERAGETFRSTDSKDHLMDSTGRRWHVGEEALTLPAGEERLARLPGHLAYWFGWYGFFPDAEVYGVTPPSPGRR
jgi:hypothetical protein